MEHVLMFTDKEQFNKRIREHSAHLEMLNNILTAYKVMNLPELTAAEFIQLISHPGVVVFDKMTKGEPVSIMGMPVNKAKAMDLILKPDGFSQMLDVIEVFKKTSNWHNHAQNADISNGKIVLKKSVIDHESETSKVYAKTENEKKLYQFAKAVVEAANTSFGDNCRYDLGSIVEDVISTRETPTGTFDMPLPKYSFEINARKIKNFGEPGNYTGRKSNR